MQKKKYINLLGQSIKDWKFWTKLLIGLTQIASIVIFLAFAGIVEGNSYVVQEHLSYFTTLSNLFCGIFFIYSAFFHHHEGKGIFDNSEVAKIAVTYITLTIFIYNLNEIMSPSAYQFDSWKYTMSFFCEHSLVPLFAIIYYLFFYNHENIQNLKAFSKKWVWYMIIGLVAYLVFFSIIGEIGKLLNWKPLFNTTDGKQTTFVYPFLDWYHGVGFFKRLPAWFECIVMLTGTVIASLVIEYVYTLIVLALHKNKKNEWQKGVFGDQEIKNIEVVQDENLINI